MRYYIQYHFKETVVINRSKIACLALLLSWQSNPAYALPDQIRVRLFDALKPFSTLDIRGPFEVIKPVYLRFGNGLYRASIKNNQIELGTRSHSKSIARSIVGSQLLLSSITGRGIGLMPLGHQMRYYTGHVQISINRKVNRMYRPFRNESKDNRQEELYSGSAIAVTNLVPVEDYINSVVGSETLPNCPSEAVKAQAVLVLTKLEQMHERLISDSTQDQAYLGLNHVRKGVEDAVRQVWNERLVYDGCPVLVFFHACCAGGTSSGIDIFGRPADVPYLKGVKCSYCKSSNFWKPTRTTIDLVSFSQVFGDPLPTIEKRDSSLRPTLITLSQHHKNKESYEHKKTIEISGYQFWIKLGQSFGWEKAPGIRFSFSKNGNKVVISSTGAGHGVGLCQWGAAEQARLGKRYDEILRYYFQGTKVQRPDRP